MTEENKQEQSVENNELVVPEIVFSRFLIKSKIVKSENQALVVFALLFICVAFIPLEILYYAFGLNRDSSVHLTLNADYITLTRYLLVAPILIVSEALTRPFISRAAVRLLKIIPKEQYGEYKELFKKVFFLRTSWVVHIILLLIAIIISIFATTAVLEVDLGGWHSKDIDGRTVLTMPGMWEAVVSQPLYKFIILNWVVDYLLWVYFLWRVSRLNLNIICTHPDGVGGLGFIRVTQNQYAVSAFALSCAICGLVAQMVQHMNLDLKSFTNLGVVFLIVALIVFACPLLVFTPAIVKSKMNGVFTYGSLCFEMSEQFADKWTGPNAKKNQPVVASTDPSAIADLGAAYQIVLDMKPMVISRQFIISFVVMMCLPAFPLITSVIPLKDLLQQIFKALT